MRRTDTRNAPTYTWIHGRGFFTSRHNRRCPGTWSLSYGERHMHCAGSRHGTGSGWVQAAGRSGAGQVSQGVTRSTAVTHGTHGRCGCGCGAGRALARASADTRQPPSQWRSGRVRARALRRSLPNLSDPLRHLTT